MKAYDEFLTGKRISAQAVGFDPQSLHPDMFAYQRDVTRWAIRRGRAALFGGIGSEGYVAVQMGRRAVICELKRSYFAQAVLNLRHAEAGEKQPELDFESAALA